TGGEQLESSWAVVTEFIQKSSPKWEELLGLEIASNFLTKYHAPFQMDEILEHRNLRVLQEVYNTFEQAGKLASELSPDNRGIAVRHIIATLLFDPTSSPRVRRTLTTQDIDIDKLRSAFFTTVAEGWPIEDRDTWRKLVQPERSGDIWEDASVRGEVEGPAQAGHGAGRYPRVIEIEPVVGEISETVFAGYAADSAEEKEDLLGIKRDVNAICSILAARHVPLPLSLGLFGDWGTGKTFFMNRMHDQIELLADKSKGLPPDQTAYSPNIVQIRFNAWHYIDANLWASLVTHILDSLYNYLLGKPDNPWNDAVENLEQAEGLHEAARHNLTQAEKSVEKAQSELQTIQNQREKKQQYIELQFNSLKNLLTDDIKEQFNKVTKDFGLDEALKSVDDLSDQLQEMKSRSGRLKSFFAVMLHSKYALPYFGLLLLVLLLPIAIGVVIPQFTQEGGAAVEFGTLISQFGTVVVGVFAWLKKPMGWLKKGLTTLERVQEEAENARQAKVTAHKNDPAEEEFAVLQEKERAAREALRESKKRLQQAQIELEEAQPSRRLYRLIEERTKSDDYQSRLGIISLIRNDFERLSSLIRPEKEWIEKLKKQGKLLPKPIPIDRIILYIDDLDRCPQHRVVEVLEAVHLLLAFPIFAVVVGVDPRWLRRSLELHYPHLLTSLSEDGTTVRTNHGSTVRRSSRTRAATPQNYLEKIFQIPFNLRPMGKGGYQALVEKLSEIPHTQDIEVSDTEQTEQQTESNVETTNVVSIAKEPVQTRTALPEQQQEPGQPEVESTLQQQATSSSDTPKTTDDEFKEEAQEREITTTHQHEDDLVLTPPTLEFTQQEKEYIATLYRLFNTPRAVKRFVNTYRIFRARLPDSMLEKYVGNDNEIGEYRCVMVLLGIITGFPSLAPKTMDVLFNQNSDTDWAYFVNALSQSTLTENDFPTNEMPQSISEMETDWVRMCDALSDLGKDGSLPFDMQTFARWTPQVARFSFSNILPPWRARESSEPAETSDWKHLSSQETEEETASELE
ncbi:MAG: P-loop NTPase fold protein, partial [Thioalkalispiraceae bacterium]